MTIPEEQYEEWAAIVHMVEQTLALMQQGHEEITVESLQAMLVLRTGNVLHREVILGALIDLFEREVRRWVMEFDA